MKRNLVLLLIPLICVVLMLLYPDISSSACLRSIDLCANVIIPSLFPFLVFSKILTGFGFCDILGRVFNKIMKPVFNVNGSGVSAFVLGIVSGYPIGASVTGEMYKDRLITRIEANRLLAFTNNCGPLFVIGAVGCGILGDMYSGVILYLVHIVSAVVVGVLFRFYRKRERISTRELRADAECEFRVSEVITKSVTQSAVTMLNICAFVVTFSVICEFVALVIGERYACFVTGFIEMSTGIKKLSAFDMPYHLKLAFIELLIGFAGMSVHFQTAGVLLGSGLGIKTYLIGKTLQGIIGAVLAIPVYFLTKQFKPKDLGIGQAVFSHSLETVNVLRLSLGYLGMVSVFLLFTYILLFIILKIEGDNGNEKQILHF